MAFSCKSGTFNKDTDGTGPQVVAGVGFQPKALIFWTNGHTATGFTTIARVGIGFSDGTTHRAVANNANDAASSSTMDNRSAAKILTIVNSAGTTLYEANVTTLDSDGFTLDWTVNDANAVIIHYLALGGSDLTNVKVLEKTASTSTGNVAYTGAGFLPDFAMCIGRGSTTAVGAGVDGSISLGVGKSSTKRWAYCNQGVDAVNMSGSINAMRNQRTDCIYLDQTSGNAEDALADLVSFDSHGLTLKWVNAATAADAMFWLLLKGGSYDVGASAKPTGAATATQTVSGIAFNPVGIFLQSFGIAATTTITADTDISIGAATSGSESSIWAECQDIVTTEANRNASTTNALIICDGASTVLAECDATLGAGQFELAWTTNNAVASEICWIAFGDAAAGGGSVVKDPIMRGIVARPR